MCYLLYSLLLFLLCMFFCFIKQKTSYEMRIIVWSSDVCSSDLSFTASGAIGKPLIGRHDGTKRHKRTPIPRPPRAGKIWPERGRIAGLFRRHRLVRYHLPKEEKRPGLDRRKYACSAVRRRCVAAQHRSEEQQSEHQSLMTRSYAVYC